MIRSYRESLQHFRYRVYKPTSVIFAVQGEASYFFVSMKQLSLQ